MNILIPVISSDLKLFEQLKDIIEVGVGEAILLEPQAESVLKFVKENKSEICLIMLDFAAGMPLDEVEKIQKSPGTEYLSWMALLGDVQANAIIQLSRRGFSHFEFRNQLASEGFKDELDLILGGYVELRVQREFKYEFEKKLFYEYEKNSVLFESLNAGVLVTSPIKEDGSFYIQEINSEIARLLNRKPDELLEQSSRNLTEGDLKDPSLSAALSISHNDFTENDTAIIQLDREKYLQRSINPFRNRQGDILGNVWLFTDVTSEVAAGYVDPLTGLYNRRFMKEGLVKEYERIVRYGDQKMDSLAVIITDIDDFKKINDTYGHPEGDRILRESADIFKREVRNVDMVCRYGGEEFIVALPGTDIEKAADVAERLRKSVAEHDFNLGHPIYISLGVAALKEDNPGGRTFIANDDLFAALEELTKQADEALYRAKHGGKNQVQKAI